MRTGLFASAVTALAAIVSSSAVVLTSSNASVNDGYYVNILPEYGLVFTDGMVYFNDNVLLRMQLAGSNLNQTVIDIMLNYAAHTAFIQAMQHQGFYYDPATGILSRQYNGEEWQVSPVENGHVNFTVGDMPPRNVDLARLLDQNAPVEEFGRNEEEQKDLKQLRIDFRFFYLYNVYDLLRPILATVPTVTLGKDYFEIRLGDNTLKIVVSCGGYLDFEVNGKSYPAQDIAIVTLPDGRRRIYVNNQEAVSSSAMRAGNYLAVGPLAALAVAAMII